MFTAAEPKPIYLPTIKTQEMVRELIKKHNVEQDDRVAFQSKTYSYCLEVNTSREAKFCISLSRKSSEFSNAVQLLKVDITEKNVAFSPIGQDIADDVLLTLFTGMSIYNQNALDVIIVIPGVCRLILLSNGSVLMDKDHETALLSAYDLTISTSAKLTIQSLVLTSLTLNVKKSKLSGIVTTKNLSIQHQTINLLGLKAHTISGSGSLINQGQLELEGTVFHPAVLSIA